MIRKCSMLLALVMAGIVLGTALVGPSQGQGRRDRRVVPLKSPPFVHTVFFYLKKDAPANEADALIADAQKSLAKIPTVRGIRAGKPATQGDFTFRCRYLTLDRTVAGDIHLLFLQSIH